MSSPLTTSLHTSLTQIARAASPRIAPALLTQALSPRPSGLPKTILRADVIGVRSLGVWHLIERVPQGRNDLGYFRYGVMTDVEFHSIHNVDFDPCYPDGRYRGHAFGHLELLDAPLAIHEPGDRSLYWDGEGFRDRATDRVLRSARQLFLNTACHATYVL